MPARKRKSKTTDYIETTDSTGKKVRDFGIDKITLLSPSGKFYSANLLPFSGWSCKADIAKYLEETGKAISELPADSQCWRWHNLASPRVEVDWQSQDPSFFIRLGEFLTRLQLSIEQADALAGKRQRSNLAKNNRKQKTAQKKMLDRFREEYEKALKRGVIHSKAITFAANELEVDERTGKRYAKILGLTKPPKQSGKK